MRSSSHRGPTASRSFGIGQRPHHDQHSPMADEHIEVEDDEDTLVRAPETDSASGDRAAAKSSDRASYTATPHGQDAAPLVDASPLPPPSDRGDGRYLTKSLLGEGGMGKIHLAQDSRIGRDVAMKVLRTRYGTQKDTVARFVREARVQGQLEHPSIVPVYDLGRTPDGKLSFTMKRVRGKTIEQIVNGLCAKDKHFVEQYPRRKLLRAFSAACQAVDFAHTRGVLHRDLKPSNIMLGDYGEVYVLDWGLAKVAGLPDIQQPNSAVSVGDESRTETIDGAVLGTPGYMAPEQARGETTTMDVRSDVYSLGAILYEMLALQPLHQRSTVSSMMHSTVLGADGRPSFRSPQRSIPSELDAICVKATQLDQGHRFASARELHDAIERYLDGEQDLKLMREMAQAHARAGEVASEYALAGGPNAHEERVRALREIGRALALDPSHPEAQRVLLKLLQEPPQELPSEAQAEMMRDDENERLLTTNFSGYIHLSGVVTTLLVLWMGVKSWTALHLYMVATAAACGAAFYTSRRGFRDSAIVNVIAGTLSIGFMSTMFGPLFLIPGLAAMATMASSFALPSRSARALVISIGVLAVLVPLSLEAVGLLPPSYHFTDAGLLILPRMHEFPKAATLAFLCYIGLGHIVVVSTVMARLHEARIKATQKLHKQTWQLKQLVSDDQDRRP